METFILFSLALVGLGVFMLFKFVAWLLRPEQPDRQDQIRELMVLIKDLQSRVYALETRSGQNIPPAPAPAPASPEPPAPEEFPAASVNPVEIPAESRVEKEGSGREMELDLGKFWLNKVGIVIFALGVAFLITYTFKYFGPFLKILFGYALSAGLFYAGLKLEKQDALRNYGRVILGGAWAIVYFTTYAMQHFEASRIIASQAADLALLAVVSLAMVAFSLRYRSEELSAVALFVGYITSTMGDVTWFTLASSLLLALATLSLVWKMKWTKLMVFGTVLTYGVHFIWVFKHLFWTGGGNFSAREVYFLLNTGFLSVYWALFTASAFLIPSGDDRQDRSIAGNCFINFLLFFFLTYPKLYMTFPEATFWFCLGMGVLYAVLSVLAFRLKKERLFVSNALIAISLLTFSVSVRMIPFHTSVFWFIELPGLLYFGTVMRRRSFRILALCLAVILFFRFIFIDFGVSWKQFLSLLAFFSSAACFMLYRLNRPSADELEGNLPDFFSGLSVFYLTVWVWLVLPLRLLTCALAVEGLALLVLGFMMRERFLRICALAVMAVCAFRFLFLDALIAEPAFTRRLMIGVVLICFHCAYFIYKRLSQSSALIFICALTMVLSTIFTRIPVSWISLALGLTGVLEFCAGFILEDKVFRYGGFVLFGLTLLRVLLADLSGLPIIYKIVSFIVLGILFLGVSFLYNRIWKTGQNSVS